MRFRMLVWGIYHSHSLVSPETGLRETGFQSSTIGHGISLFLDVRVVVSWRVVRRLVVEVFGWFVRIVEVIRKQILLLEFVPLVILLNYMKCYQRKKWKNMNHLLNVSYLWNNCVIEVMLNILPLFVIKIAVLMVWRFKQSFIVWMQ